jgi:hypothetical protein
MAQTTLSAFTMKIFISAAAVLIAAVAHAET